MIGDSAAPRYEAGDTVYIDPTLPPAISRWCAFWQADRRTARVGKLVGITDGSWEVEQLHPRVTQELARADWPHVRRITGCGSA